jgi:ferredoxin/flavodoxin
MNERKELPMETKIFYFSTTGNSLNLARALSDGLGGAELISIPAAMGLPTVVRAEKVGFVVPVYAWGLPSIVVEFLKDLKLEGKPYVFGIATCGGTPGRTLLELRKLLRKAGADLHAGFACREGANTVAADPGFVTYIRRINKRIYQPGSERLPEMLSVIRGNKAHKPDTSTFGINCFGAMMHGMVSMMAGKLKSTDANYSVDGHCAGCRTCERICPRGNIKVEGNGPVWRHNCEMCNACIQWCPQQAIHVANETRRYHNPAIKAQDLILRD